MSTVSELVVSLGLNTTTFHSKIKEVNQTMKLVKSEFENASAGVKNFQSTQDGLKTKISSLNSQIDVTKTKISLYKTEIENTKKKLEEKNKTLQDTTKRYQEQKAKVETLTKEYGENSKEVKEAKEELAKLEVELAQNEKAVLNTTTQLKRYQTELNLTETELKNLNSQVAQTERELSGLGWSNLGTQLQEVGSIVTGVGEGFVNVGKKISVVSTAVAGLGTAALKTSINFESQMSRVEAISGATGKELESLTDKAREMGKATSFSATDAAKGLEYMALAGWETSEMLTGIEPVLRLAEAGNLDLGRASDLVTDSMSAMGKSVDELGTYLDMAAKTSTIANTNIEDLMLAFIEVGQTANTLGADTAELSGA